MLNLSTLGQQAMLPFFSSYVNLNIPIPICFRRKVEDFKFRFLAFLGEFRIDEHGDRIMDYNLRKYKKDINDFVVSHFYCGRLFFSIPSYLLYWSCCGQQSTRADVH